MNNVKRWFSIAVGSGLAVLLLVGVLTVIPALAQGPGGMGGRGMRGGGMTHAPAGSAGVGGGYGYNGDTPSGYGPGWMTHAPARSAGVGATQGFSGTNQFGYGPGWMMGDFGGMMDGGMMVNPNSPFYTAPESLTLAQTTDTLNAYVTSLNDSNLAVGEVMIFDNHAYAQIVEKDSGIGVMEVLVDPTTQAVYPEMGPNMMWNLKYGMTLAPARSAGVSGFGRYGMMGGMMGGFGNNMMSNFSGNADVSPDQMTVTPEQAVEAAQSYLDTYFSEANLTADEHADPFYGYYTLHVNRDGQPVGMLSVNGFTGQVFPHTWHGELLEMSGE
jgi:hypothetical protein